MSTAIVITSGKGGTGKTSITGGVASCLAALGHRVLCIDMDIGLRNLDLTLGLSDRALMDFTDVLCGRCTLERAAVDVYKRQAIKPDRVRLVSTLAGPMWAEGELPQRGKRGRHGASAPTGRRGIQRPQVGP